MEKLKEIVTQSIEKQFKDGSVNEIIDKAVHDAIKQIITDTFGWTGEARKYLKERIDNIMLGALQDTDFEEYVATIKNIINKAIPETALEEYKTFVEGLQYTLGKKTEKFQKVTLSQLLEEYAKWVEKQSFSYDDCETVEEGYASLTCSVEHVEEEEKNIYVKPTHYLDFRVLGVDCPPSDYDIKIEITDNYDHNFRIKTNYELRDYRSLNPFELYLLELENNYATIILNEEGLEQDIEVEVEY